jgi:hypothetical protein
MSVALSSVVEYSNQVSGFDEAEAALCPKKCTEQFVADNRKGDKLKYRVFVFIRILDPKTGKPKPWGWYRIGLVAVGEKVEVEWGQTFCHQVISFAFRWRSGATLFTTQEYDASPGMYFETLGIEWKKDGTYSPILVEVPI